MVSAQPALKIKKAYTASILLIIAALIIPNNVRAATGGPQKCIVGSDCTIGEFLYDDSSQPIATASCKITSHDPSGNLYIDNATMSAAIDGWYSYQIASTPTTTGLYRAEVCCSVDSDRLCIDKSFEVGSDASSAPSADSIATAVWGYSGRTLSNFGDLASDVWNSSSRTLTSFGSLVSNIWDNTSRTITGTSATTSTNADLSDIKKTVKENRLLLEKLVNKPIIENFVEDDNTPDLNAKINDSKTIATQLFANYQYIGSKSDTIVSKWGVTSEADLLTAVNELSNLLGESNDNKSQNSIFGQINWMKGSWDWKEIDSIYDQTQAVKNTLATVQMQLGSYGKNRYAEIEMKSVVPYMDTLEKILGESSDTLANKTLFGELNQVADTAKVLDERLADVDSILSSWPSTKAETLVDKINTLLTKIVAINKIPNINSVLAAGDNSDYPADKRIKNKLFGMRGIVVSNKMLLARGAGKALSNTWVQEGSIVFKSLITNPSALVTQDVPLKYYLPPEVKKENIIEVSDGLKIQYDTEKNQFYVEGTFSLAPKETRTVMVRVEDIWVISDSEVESLRKQAEELSKPLERTSYFAQGVTLKSDINVSLDKILQLKNEGVTPEAKIKAYREAQLELNSVNEKMDKLQDLVTQAGSTSTFFGFVGGAQTLAVWGLIIIMITGFVSLVIYMRTLGVRGKKKKKEEQSGSGKNTGENVALKEQPLTHKNTRHSLKAFASYFLVAFISGIISTVLTTVIVRRLTLSSVNLNSDVAQQEENTQLESNNQDGSVAGITTPENASAVGGAEIVRVVPPEGTRVNVRKTPSLNGVIIDHFSVPYDVIKLGSSESWVEVAYGDLSDSGSDYTGWVAEEFVQTKETLEQTSDDNIDTNNEVMVTILETPTGWLRVRSEPKGVEIDKVNTGEKYTLISQDGGWYQIALSETSSGWISSEYASLE